MDYALAIGGLVLLFLGGESLIRGAVGLARKLDVSPLFTGLVVVGFGTSAPEFVVCLEAALRGQYDITIGNIVGSNIANLMLILGVAALIQPILSRASILKRDGLAMLVASVMLVGLAFLGEISRIVGLILLAMLIGFIVVCWVSERAQKGEDVSELEDEIEDVGKLPGRTSVALLAVLSGIVALVFGSNMLIEGATGIAIAFGIPQAVIGVTLVAIGTSLPELAAVIVAAIRNHADVALGNVLGSNVFNVFGMLGLTAVIEPLHISRAFLDLDMWVMLGVSALLLVFLTTGNRLNRGESLLLLVAYAAYVAFLLDPVALPAPAA
ncbi:calcium/sodium antiporter [Rhodovibrio salinarum]|uniref:Sodium:calcium antiporter n=1 Tax=Rhodovibrio salinarum TaxID=1087 RepID=A0A934QLC1_9PROT|nr:calcium/sodium antiporter [Rhodovibrio salinarum]MBK1698640.1 sodium:calcium antiporter [Rhodovibrio salinarum]